MTSSNLRAVAPAEKTEVNPKFQHASILRAVMQYGDKSSIARAYPLSSQIVDEWVSGERWNPFDSVAVFTEQLRRNANPAADEPFKILAHRLDFTVFRNARSVDDEKFAQLLNEVSDVVRKRAEIDDPNSDGGTEHTPAELRALAREAKDLAEEAHAYAQTLLRQAAAKETR